MCSILNSFLHPDSIEYQDIQRDYTSETLQKCIDRNDKDLLELPLLIRSFISNGQLPDLKTRSYENKCYFCLDVPYEKSLITDLLKTNYPFRVPQRQYEYLMKPVYICSDCLFHIRTAINEYDGAELFWNTCCECQEHYLVDPHEGYTRDTTEDSHICDECLSSYLDEDDPPNQVIGGQYVQRIHCESCREDTFLNLTFYQDFKVFFHKLDGVPIHTCEKCLAGLELDFPPDDPDIDDDKIEETKVKPFTEGNKMTLFSDEELIEQASIDARQIRQSLKNNQSSFAFVYFRELWIIQLFSYHEHDTEFCSYDIHEFLLDEKQEPVIGEAIYPHRLAERLVYNIHNWIKLFDIAFDTCRNLYDAKTEKQTDLNFN